MRRALIRASKKFERQRWYLFATLLAQAALTYFMAGDDEFKQAGIAVAGIAIIGVVTKNPKTADSRRRWVGYAVPLLFIVPSAVLGLDEINDMVEWGIQLEAKNFAWMAPVVAALVSMADWRATLAVPPVTCPECHAVIRTR